MQPDGIIKALQVLENGDPRLLSALEAGAIGTLFGECGKEGLHGCIIPTIAGSAHTHLNTQFTQCDLIAIGSKLSASISMMQQANFWMPPRDSHAQRQFNQGAVFAGRHRPTYH